MSKIKEKCGEGKKNPFFIASKGLCVCSSSIAKKSWLLLSRVRGIERRKRRKSSIHNREHYFLSEFFQILFLFLSFFFFLIAAAALKCISFTWGWGCERISKDAFISDEQIFTETRPALKFYRKITHTLHKNVSSLK